MTPGASTELLAVLALAAVASLAACGAMHLDKRRAARGMRRLRERTLAAYALLGGWPGIVAGALMWRHKTRAWGFQAKVALAAAAHGALAWWVVT